jgi:hypothetical protein
MSLFSTKVKRPPVSLSAIVLEKVGRQYFFFEIEQIKKSLIYPLRSIDKKISLFLPVYCYQLLPTKPKKIK